MKEREEKSLRFVIHNYREGAFNTQKALKKIIQVKDYEKKLRRLWLYGSGIAASLIICAGSFMYFRASEEKLTYITADAEITKHTLPDSTIVTLAPGTYICYNSKNFTSNTRNVTMKGKAYFSVKRNPESPFIVQGSHSMTKVLGTQFQINELRPDSVTDIYVTSGKVLFCHSLNDNSGVTLTKGMEAVMPFSSNTPQITETETPNPSAWANGVFVYNNTPIDKVLKELSAFYKVKLSTTQHDKVLTAEFEADSLDEIILLIEKTLEIKITKE